MIKMAEETNMTITEMERVILKASTHNQMMNAIYWEYQKIYKTWFKATWKIGCTKSKDV